MKQQDLTKGIIWKQMLIYFFPLLIGYLFQQLYNTVDSMIVGKFVSSSALAAVGSTGTLINLLVGFFIGLSSGAGVIISQYYGAKDEKNLSKSVHTGIALAILGGAILTVIGIVLAPQALHLINVPDDIFDQSLLYMRIYFLGMIASMLYNMGAGILRAIGDSKRPRDYLIITCILNIILDIIFVFIFHLEVAGVAIATVLAQSISAYLTIRTLCKSTDIYHLDLKKVHFHLPILISMMKIGLPAGGQSVLYSISNLAIQSSVNTFGTNTIAAWTAFGKIDAIIWFVLSAFGVTVLTFAGQNYGAKKYDRIKVSVRTGLIMSGLSISLISLLLFIFRIPLLYLFTNESDVIKIGSGILTIQLPFYVFFIFNEVFSSTIKGTGEGLIPMLITVFTICLFRLVWILCFIPTHHNISWVVTSYPITWILSSVVFTVYYIYYSKKKFI